MTAALTAARAASLDDHLAGFAGRPASLARHLAGPPHYAGAAAKYPITGGSAALESLHRAEHGQPRPGGRR